MGETIKSWMIPLSLLAGAVALVSLSVRLHLDPPVCIGQPPPLAKKK